VRGNPGRAPPPPRYEQPSGPHAAGTVWIAGYWMPRGYEHQWVPGHWAYPPAPNYDWQAPRWENANGSWTFYEGHWLPQQPPQVAVPFTEPPPPMDDQWTMQPPPAPMNEYQPPMPFGNALWIPGYWHWNNIRFAWVAGRWSARPPLFYWEPHRWVRSPDGRYREQPGYWRR
jgi:YXWGXW repeat-containing protein